MWERDFSFPLIGDLALFHLYGRHGFLPFSHKRSAVGEGGYAVGMGFPSLTSEAPWGEGVARSDGVGGTGHTLTKPHSPILINAR